MGYLQAGANHFQGGAIFDKLTCFLPLRQRALPGCQGVGGGWKRFGQVSKAWAFIRQSAQFAARWLVKACNASREFSRRGVPSVTRISWPRIGCRSYRWGLLKGPGWFAHRFFRDRRGLSKCCQSKEEYASGSEKWCGVNGLAGQPGFARPPCGSARICPHPVERALQDERGGQFIDDFAAALAAGVGRNQHAFGFRRR